MPGAATPLEEAGFDVELLSTGGPPPARVLCAAVVGADALVCQLNDTIDDDVLKAGGQTLRVVANVAVGVDNVDLASAHRRGVTVSNTPGVLDAATADLAMALLLAVTRRVLQGVELIRTGRWTGFAATSSLGRDLAGMRLGLVGFGRIGRKVAQRAAAFEMVVHHHARHETGASGYVASLDALLAESDAVSLHVPLTPHTRHLLDQRRLDLLPAGAVIINTARGQVLDEAALASSLRSGRLGGAGLDVFDNEPSVSATLLEAPNVVLTPHIGSATTETRGAMCSLAVQSVIELLAGRAWPHLVVDPGDRASGGR